MPFDILGIENPLIDVLVPVTESFLAEAGLEKNRTFLVDRQRQAALLDALQGLPAQVAAGGSCANTMVGIAQLGGRVAYCGKVGDDEHGRAYVKLLRQAGVTPYVRADGSMTGSTVILVTPDAARTMYTHLGACQELTAGDVPLEALLDSRRLYLTGYVWDTPQQQEAALLALRTASDAGIPVTFSLADPFCVSRHREDFARLLPSHVDLVLANRDEATSLTGTDNPQEALQVLREWCPMAVVTLGHAGALIAQGATTWYVEAQPVHPVDTTGAGDAFAAGFLAGLASGASPFQCGRLGAAFAAQVIRQVGPRLQGDVPALLAPVLNDPRP